MTRKLIFTLATLIALIGFVLPTVPITRAQDKGASCDDIKVICDQEATAWYWGCLATSGPLGVVWCWPASEDKEQLCVKEKSGGKCSLFH